MAGVFICAPELLAPYPDIYESKEQQLASIHHITLESPSRSDKVGVVKVECGRVAGKRLKTRVWAFTGIPYAAAPTGKLRWQPPVGLRTAHKCWNGTFDATKFGNTCVQKVSGFGVIGKEDCLVVNVYTPRLPSMGASTALLKQKHAPRTSQLQSAPAADGGLLPVVVFLHGGSWEIGSNSLPFHHLNPLDRLANATQVVTIGINYRLNAFGFMALDVLSKRDKRGVSGNYGLLDILEGLQWVQRNARSFGGDPTKVTLLGSSSGATAIYCLLAAPSASAGLFHAAFVQSASPRIDKTLQQASKENAVFINRSRCSAAADVATCLVNLTSREVLEAIPWDVYPFWSHDLDFTMPRKGDHMAALGIVDGKLLDKPPSEVIGTEHALDVPLVIGVMAQENGWAAGENVAAMDWLKLKSFLSSFERPWSAKVGQQLAKLYSPLKAQPPQYIYDTITTDVRVTCGNLYMANRAAMAGRSGNKYFYYATAEPHKGLFLLMGSAPEYACHQWDLINLLDSFESLSKVGLSTYKPTADDARFGKELQAALKSLAYTHTIPQWHTIGNDTKSTSSSSSASYWSNQVGRKGVKFIQGLKADVCHFWDMNDGFHYWWAGE
jgi:carboxylesterase type B